jgi:hypothetical protein
VKVNVITADLADSPAAFDAVIVMEWLPGVNAGNVNAHVKGDAVPVQVTPDNATPAALPS